MTDDPQLLHEVLERAQDGHRDHLVPARLLELVRLASEIAEALAAPSLDVAERQRLYMRALQLTGGGANGHQRMRLTLELRRLGRNHQTLVGAAGALAAAAVTVALLRGRSPRAPGIAA
jgi:hypothetical protein